MRLGRLGTSARVYAFFDIWGVHRCLSTGMAVMSCKIGSSYSNVRMRGVGACQLQTALAYNMEGEFREERAEASTIPIQSRS